ncbi:MAG: ATP-binding protein [bacterium]
MKLLFRFTAVLFAALVLVLTAAAWVGVRSRKLTFDVDMRRDHRQIAQILTNGIERAWQSGGQAELERLVHDTTAAHAQITVRWRARGEGADEAAYAEIPAQVRERVARGESVSVRLAHPGEGEFLHTFVPVAYGGRTGGVIELAESLEDERAFVRASIKNAIGTTVVVAAVSASLAAALGTFLVGRPIGLLVEKARRVGFGDLGGPLHLRTGDELAELATELNLMCDRLASARDALAAESERRIAALEQLRHADRLSTVGKLAAGVAHELGTPLNVVSGRARMIETRARDSAVLEIGEHARIIDDQVKRMARIIRQLLDFARRREAHRAPTPAAPLAQRVATMLAPMARRAGVEISVALPAAAPELVTDIDASQIEQVLTNVVVNGIQAMPSGGPLEVRVDHADAIAPATSGKSGSRWIRFDVVDHGQGIPPEALPHVFEPFFTTKAVGEGTGLGLSVSYGIVNEHGGWIDITSELGHGTRVSIFLPEADAR